MNLHQMSGSLLDPERKCLRCHAQLHRQPGIFSLPQVAHLSPGGLHDTGLLYVVNVLNCKTCGMVELVDADIKLN